MKNPLTPAGIEPATFRFVAQHLNHCATAAPCCTVDIQIIVLSICVFLLRWFVVCRGITILLRHTILGWTTLEEWSVRRREFYLTKQNSHKRQASMPLAGLEPAIPASERPQSLALNPATTGTCTHVTTGTCTHVTTVTCTHATTGTCTHVTTGTCTHVTTGTCIHVTTGTCTHVCMLHALCFITVIYLTWSLSSSFICSLSPVAVYVFS